MSREQELERQLAALKEERRKEDADRWKEQKETQKEQIAYLKAIDLKCAGTDTRLISVERRLVDGDTRFAKVEQDHKNHEITCVAAKHDHDTRIRTMELEAVFWKRVRRWALGLCTTLGMGWLLTKLGWK